MVPAVNARTGLHLHTSNRLEVSAAELAEIIARPAGSIFEPETVVVQSVGMGRWLSLLSVPAKISLRSFRCGPAGRAEWPRF
jgi:hypothetical protein